MNRRPGDRIARRVRAAPVSGGGWPRRAVRALIELDLTHTPLSRLVRYGATVGLRRCAFM